MKGEHHGDTIRSVCYDYDMLRFHAMIRISYHVLVHGTLTTACTASITRHANLPPQEACTCGAAHGAARLVQPALIPQQ